MKPSRFAPVTAALLITVLAVAFLGGCREKIKRTDELRDFFSEPIRLENIRIGESTKGDVNKYVNTPHWRSIDDEGNETFLYAIDKLKVETVNIDISRPVVNTAIYCLIFEFEGDILKDYYVRDLERNIVTDEEPE